VKLIGLQAQIAQTGDRDLPVALVFILESFFLLEIYPEHWQYYDGVQKYSQCQRTLIEPSEKAWHYICERFK
jgi:hypothetical protein